MFEAKLTPRTSSSSRTLPAPGRDGSGTGGFAGVTGRLNFKDIITASPITTYVYRGHLSLG